MSKFGAPGHALWGIFWATVNMKGWILGLHNYAVLYI